MGWMDVLRQYQGSPGSPPPGTVQDFERVAREAPPDELGAGLEHAFRSEQTPRMEEMFRQLYENSNREQRAGFLDHIRDALRPGTIPDDTNDVTPQDVEAIGQAARNNPTLLQRATRFYAQHPQVVQMLGQAVLGVAMNAMAQRRRI